MQNINATQKIDACSFDISFNFVDRKITAINRLVKTRAYIYANNTSDILQLFSERYKSPSRKTTNAIKKSIINQINVNTSLTLSESDISLKWSQYAGCSCPCSPGYIVTFQNQSVPFEYKYHAAIVAKIK